MLEKPFYKLKNKNGKYIYIDITTSCASQLKANNALYKAIEIFKKKNVESILDFGAGCLRHVFPLLEKGFRVYAVEFKNQFEKANFKKKLESAQRSKNFSLLIFPNPFIYDTTKFDAVILAFVLQIMPQPKERKELLKIIKSKMNENGLILWMSQYGKYKHVQKEENKVKDGWYFNPKRKYRSFYTEFKNGQIDQFFERINFELYKKIPGNSGHDQFRIYKSIKSK